MTESASGMGVYVAQGLISRLVKIGFTVDIETRLMQLEYQVKQPMRRLGLLSSLLLREEKWLHTVLAEHCVGNEWYKPEGKVLTVVEMASSPDAASIKVVQVCDRLGATFVPPVFRYTPRQMIVLRRLSASTGGLCVTEVGVTVYSRKSALAPLIHEGLITESDDVIPTLRLTDAGRSLPADLDRLDTGDQK